MGSVVGVEGAGDGEWVSPPHPSRGSDLFIIVRSGRSPLLKRIWRILY